MSNQQIFFKNQALLSGYFEKGFLSPVDINDESKLKILNSHPDLANKTKIGSLKI